MIIIQCDKCDLRLTLHNNILHNVKGSLEIYVGEKEEEHIRLTFPGQETIEGESLQFCAKHTAEMVGIKQNAEKEKYEKLKEWAGLSPQKEGKEQYER